MRILLLSDWMSNSGGAERYITSLHRALADSGDEVHLLGCGVDSALPDSIDSRVFGSDSIAAQALLQIANPFAFSRVRKCLRDFRPDVAVVSQFAYHMSPAVLPALAPVPTVVTMMDYKAICPVGTRLLPDGSLCTVMQGSACRRNGCVGTVHWLRDRPRYALIGSTLRRAHRVLCASESMRAELARAGIEAETLQLGVPLPEADFQRVPAESPAFVYCGRLSREKGVALAIAALARLDGKAESARLRIVGDGPLMPELMQLAEVLGVSERVDFTGWVPADRLDDELADAWALVAPSLWAEPFGLVAVEAVVRGIPVIASDAGGMHETVREGASGLLFPNGDVAALTERMRAIAERTAFPDHRIDAATVTRAIDSFGIESHATRLRTILSDVAALARN